MTTQRVEGGDSCCFKNQGVPGVVMACAFNPNNPEAEAGTSL